VTNQRRILDDNAPENSRSEAQLLVVKIRRGCRRTCKKGTPQSKKHSSFFTNAFETLGTRWRAGRLEVTGSDTRTSCGMYSYKRQTRTLASSGHTERRIPGSHPPHRLSQRRRAADQGKAKQAPILSHPATVGSHTIIIATMGCLFSKQKRAPGPGRHDWFEPSTQGMHAADSRLSPRIFHAADIKPTICEPRACQQSVSQHCAWRQIPHTSILGCFGIRSAPPHTSERRLRGAYHVLPVLSAVVPWRAFALVGLISYCRSSRDTRCNLFLGEILRRAPDEVAIRARQLGLQQPSAIHQSWQTAQGPPLST
jgi:hypothetical protein